MLTDSSFFRRAEIQLLMYVTARALGQPCCRTWTLRNDKALQAYADFTSRHLVNQSDDVLRQLNDEAFRMGTKLRRLFFLKEKSSAVRLIVSLYRNIGIDLEMMENGTLCFRHCFFSSCYTPAVCVAASALDEGFIRRPAGLPSSRLCFSQRITEGFSCCLATMNKRNIQRNSNCQDVRHHTVPSPDDFRGEVT